jgi:hypothetical protein
MVDLSIVVSSPEDYCNYISSIPQKASGERSCDFLEDRRHRILVRIATRGLTIDGFSMIQLDFLLRFKHQNLELKENPHGIVE